MEIEKILFGLIIGLLFINSASAVQVNFHEYNYINISSYAINGTETVSAYDFMNWTENSSAIKGSLVNNATTYNIQIFSINTSNLTFLSLKWGFGIMSGGCSGSEEMNVTINISVYNFTSGEWETIRNLHIENLYWLLCLDETETINLYGGRKLNNETRIKVVVRIDDGCTYGGAFGTNICGFNSGEYTTYYFDHFYNDEFDRPPQFIIQPYNDSTTAYSSDIKWTTDEPANYSLSWGVCPAYDTYNVSNNTFVLSHTQNLSNLSSNTNYCVNVSVWDDRGLLNFSLMSFTTSKLSVNITSPENRTYTDETTLPLNYTIEGDKDICWYYRDGTRIWLLSCQNTTLYNLTFDQHNVTVCMNNTYGEIVCDEVLFKIIEAAEEEKERGGGGGVLYQIPTPFEIVVRCGDGICDIPIENEKNCPQDCSPYCLEIGKVTEECLVDEKCNISVELIRKYKGLVLNSFVRWKAGDYKLEKAIPELLTSEVVNMGSVVFHNTMNVDGYVKVFTTCGNTNKEIRKQFTITVKEREEKVKIPTISPTLIAGIILTILALIFLPRLRSGKRWK